MAIINRTLDTSEQYKVLSANYGLVATGVTLSVATIANPCILQAAEIAAFGLSGSPVGLFTIQRFIVGTGATVIILGSTFVPPAFGTSGVPASGVSLPASGSTVLTLLANDVICLTTSVSNTAMMALSVNLVVKPTQDIRSYFGGLA